jgi:hypothetical protein
MGGRAGEESHVCVGGVVYAWSNKLGAAVPAGGGEGDVLPLLQQVHGARLPTR